MAIRGEPIHQSIHPDRGQTGDTNAPHPDITMIVQYILMCLDNCAVLYLRNTCRALRLDARQMIMNVINHRRMQL